MNYVTHDQMSEYVKTVAVELSDLTTDLNKAKGLLCALCAFLETKCLMSAMDAVEIRENAKDIASYLNEEALARTLSRIQDILDREASE
ncbi:hypothetical protein UFOVP345_7 [uncultured Caudovirales phage]|uniref:Uncharacterized protein n=1 Tax=uncultured Caudovirales phage TaxID=2100421 RepID=A0A6J5M1S0_9CAUD|nr:hypothetical protein UFOVP345_7 [uncultured Caudovirales phage]